MIHLYSSPLLCGYGVLFLLPIAFSNYFANSFQIKWLKKVFIQILLNKHPMIELSKVVVLHERKNIVFLAQSHIEVVQIDFWNDCPLALN